MRINILRRRFAIAKTVVWAQLLCVSVVSADGLIVDKIYDPYVQPLEKEIEWRGIYAADDSEPDKQKHFFAFGKSVSERWWIEGYAIGEKESGSSFSIDAYEIEAKWQLTEQGEYAADWGVLFEIERETSDNAWEASVGVLVAKEFGRWTGSANLLGIYEWGGGIDNEFETVLRSQAKYRHTAAFEPALELFLGEDTKAAGPAIMGIRRFTAGRKLKWEFGVALGLDSDSADSTARVVLEYEF